MPRPIDVCARGLTFRCLSAGEGPLVLVLHGFPDDPTSFIPLLEDIAAAGYRAVAPWTRGYGHTDAAPDGDYAMSSLAADALALIRALGAERATLIGHDWGAIAGYAAANLGPAQIRDLITLAVPPLRRFVAKVRVAQLRRSSYIGLFQLPVLAEERLRRDDYALIDQLWATWSPGWSAPTQRLDAVKETFRQPGTVTAALAYYRALVPRIGRFGAWRRSRQLAFRRLSVSSMILAGQDDGCIGAELFERAASASDAEVDLRVLPGVGHFMHLEDPKRVHAMILQRLRERSPLT